MEAISADRSSAAGEQVMARGFNWPLAIGIITFLLLGRWVFEQISTHSLRIFLEPSALLIGLFTNASHEWMPDQGIVFTALGVMLDRSCSGFHFMLVLIASCTWWTRPGIRDGRSYILLLAFILPITYVLVIISNTMRVMSTIMAGDLDPTGWIGETASFHEFLGIIIQLLLLFLCHAAIRYATGPRAGSH